MVNRKERIEKYLNILNRRRIYIFEWDDTSKGYHGHKYIEMVYIKKGAIDHTVDGVTTSLKKGDYVFVDYGSKHSYSAVNNQKFLIINCLFYPGFIDQTLFNCKGINDILQNYLIRFKNTLFIAKPGLCVFADNNKEILKLLNLILEEQNKEMICYLEVMRSCLISIIIQSMRQITTGEKINSYDETISYILDYIEKDYAQHITLTEIGDKLHFSLPYLSVKFKKDTGLSFMQVLQKKRIEAACHYLSTTNDRVTEIAENIGFNDIKRFNFTFKKYMGTTPLQFRKDISKYDILQNQI